MSVPVSQMWTVVRYVMKQRFLGRTQYPLVLMLEPLFRCNLACAGCGKIQHPTETLRQHLTPEQCFAAVEECGAPIVSIPGGEPLLHPQIDEIVAGLIARKKYIYLCTNGILLKKHLHRFSPSPYLSFSIHLDGVGEVHDRAVCREGVYDIAVDAIREAKNAGFRVTTNSTFFRDASPEEAAHLFDTLSEMSVEGMMVSPGYEYAKAPDQSNFLPREQTKSLFKQILSLRNRKWKFNQSPLFLEFLQGQLELECRPWGNPTYNLFGWQKPCYLLEEGYASSFAELMESTDWNRYGRASGNSQCDNCMVHSGYEAAAVHETFWTWKGFARTVKLTLFGSKSNPQNNSQPVSQHSISPGKAVTKEPAPDQELVQLVTDHSQESDPA